MLTFEGMQLNNQIEDAKAKAKEAGEVRYVVWVDNHFVTVDENPGFKNIEVRVFPGGRMEALGARAKRIAEENKGKGW